MITRSERRDQKRANSRKMRVHGRSVLTIQRIIVERAERLKEKV